MEHVLWEVSLWGRGPSWLWGWSYGHLDKSGFLPALKRAHFQALLDKVKWEPVGGRAGQAAGNLDRVDPGACREGPFRSRVASEPIRPTTSFSPPPALPWVKFIVVGWAPNEDKIWSLPSRILQSHWERETHSQQRKQPAGMSCAEVGSSSKVTGGGGLERRRWWQASRSEAPWPCLCPQVSSEVGHHALNAQGDSRLTGWRKGTFLRGRIIHLCSRPLYHRSYGIRAARPGLCREIWPRLLT